ncbi:MAG TPA: PEP-CTERM sorting domain-containing protein [Methylophilaceae bacterium]|nr:PEP-CTERM sorting domain-containing protein [Methylophilaceae bacterium]
MKAKSLIVALLALGGLHSINVQAALPTTYEFTFLETLGGPTEPFSINNASQIVGYSYTDLQATTSLPVLWENNTITNLSVPGARYGRGFGINNSGQIAGAMALPGEFTSYAVVWNNKTPTLLDHLNEGGNSQAWGINDSGQVVGWSSLPDPDTLEAPVIWNGTTPTQLPTLGIPEGEARAINNSGQITGASNLGPSTNEPNFHAMLWQGNTITDLGVLPGGSYSIGLSINEAGHVVGMSSFDDTGMEHGVLWADGVMTDLGTLGSAGNFSSAWDINNLGQIVGYSQTGPGQVVATIWDEGQLYDLNSFLDASTAKAGWVLTGALSINDLGQIVGFGYNSSMRLQGGFLLTPTPIPEPETYAMLMAGLGVLGFVKRRRKAAS